MLADISSGNDQCHSEQDEENAVAEARCQGFAENQYTEEYSRERFQRTQNSRRSRADILNGLRGAEEG